MKSKWGSDSKYNKKPLNSPTLRIALIGMSCLACIGIFLCALLIPGEMSTSNGPTTNSILTMASNEAKSLSEKVMDWIPSGGSYRGSTDDLPNWNTEIWTPIDIDIGEDPMVILCRLNFKQYWEQPHSYPMFRDLEGMSKCVGSNRKRERLSDLLEDIKEKEGTPEGRIVAPTGFVFHESRVGSTLIANFLASDPWALVFSESTPIANAILHCTSCSRERQISLFRDVLTLMGRSSVHRRMFVKFQSITSTKMEIALEAFPQTPWAFVFRQPVQTMMSHLDPKKGSTSAPCLRSKRSPPEEVMSAIRSAAGKERAPNEAWCAAHLNMLCSSALRAYSKYNSTLSGEPRGLLINYEGLPGAVPNALLPLFKAPLTQNWLDKMQAESKHYSKSRGSKFRLFFGDSKDKDERATATIQNFAEKILFPTYQKLNDNAVEALKAIAPSYISNSEIGATYDWKSIKDFPIKAPAQNMMVSTRTSSAEEELGHSHALKEVEFTPWSPFSNHHDSKTFYVANCPPVPEPGYPKAFSMLDIVNNWNTDSTEIPSFHYDSLCHFDYQNSTQLGYAMTYRSKEVPFIVFNIPEVDEVVKRWGNIDYLNKLLGKKSYRTETSRSNHFMYWRGGSRSMFGGGNWKPPTDVTNRKFEDWLELAVKGQNKTLEDRVHEYFRVSSDAGNHFLFNELPFFKPKKNIFIVEPSEQRGIHCRFGMRSVIAEAHFDGSRNAVVMLGGLRRWIMTHPDQCVNMHMLPPKHPSGRHSAVDWSKPDLKQYPNFAKVMGNEVILRPGDYLFVPTYWIHYIVSLNINFQCNTRSGAFRGYDRFIRDCGF